MVATQICVIFTPTWGRFPFWLIFHQTGWNHQLGKVNPLALVDRYCSWFRVLTCRNKLQKHHGNPSYPPQSYPPPRNKALLRVYQPLVSLNKALLTRYSWGGVALGGYLRFPWKQVPFLGSSYCFQPVLRRLKTSCHPWRNSSIHAPCIPCKEGLFVEHSDDASHTIWPDFPNDSWVLCRKHPPRPKQTIPRYFKNTSVGGR